MKPQPDLPSLCRVSSLRLCRLYVDGQLVGQAAGPSADGGGPFALTGPITLCSRSNGDPDKFLDGSLAYLGESSPCLQFICTDTTQMQVGRAKVCSLCWATKRQPVAGGWQSSDPRRQHFRPWQHSIQSERANASMQACTTSR